MRRLTLSLQRLGFIALNTLREAIRQRILSLLILLGLIVVSGAQYLRDFHFGSPELKFISDLGLGAMGLFGAILAVVLTAQLFFQEIEHHTVQTLLARPVSRAEFVLGKLLAIAVILAAFCGLLTALLAVVLRVREVSLLQDWPEGITGGAVVNYASLVVMGGLQWLKLLVLAALTLLVASYARTAVFAMVTGFLIFILCHFQPLAQAASTRVGASGTSRAIASVAHLFPNFRLFGFADLASGPDGWLWSQVGRVALYGLGYAAVAGALAIFCFRRREL